jgi:hypothetical protein
MTKVEQLSGEIKQNVRKRIDAHWHKPTIMRMLNLRLNELIDAARLEGSNHIGETKVGHGKK